jgi:hypothetical protein
VELADLNQLTITAYNITHEGSEAKAAEMKLTRAKA